MLQVFEQQPVVVKGGIGVEPETSSKALQTVLEQNVPNPFNPRTSIAFTLASEGRVRLDVFDVAGRHVATLVDGVKSAGRHSVAFEASSFSLGIYFYRLEGAAGVAPRKMVLLK